jgi:hypothetical protein
MATMSNNKNITLCLNMIVKNESRIITRLFDSVIGIIDTYCICDTGSTDNTCEIIDEYFKSKNISGKIIKEPFKNFEYNRTFAAKACYGMSDYILLLDADMVLNIYNFDKQKLNHTAYYILQGCDDFYYQNIRLIKNVENIEYRGVTHEYITCPNINPVQLLSKNELFITDIGDGACKLDKFERDIRLLTEDFKNNPKNSRTVFYLANSFFDTNDLKNAIHYYKIRIELGGWVQEVWMSYYKIGLSHKKMNEIEKAIYYWLKGFDYFPQRLENIYELIKHHRIHSEHNLSLLYYNVAKNVLNKIENNEIDISSYLFLQNDVYRYKIYEEYLIIAYYVSNDRIEYNKLFNLLLNMNSVNKNQILRNHKFYVQSMQNDFDKYIKITCNDMGVDDSNFNSTPSICFLNDDIYINMRIVSYLITESGCYDIKNNHITSKNKLIKLDKNLNVKDNYILNYNTAYDDYYEGIEDMRLISYDNKLYFNGVRPIGKDSEFKIVMEHGFVDFDTKSVNSKFLSFDKQNKIEKNWVLFNYNNELYHIYSWSPLLILKVKTDEICENNENSSNSESVIHLGEVKRIVMPVIFNEIRGSTNGKVILDEIWFICHIVSHEEKRHYYHMMVVLDLHTLKLKKYSNMFTFNKINIEFCLGLDFYDNNFYITYSTMDNTSNLGIISYEKMQKYFL